jgi:hypothetical protein
MNPKDPKKEESQVAYPKPTKSDKQYQNQPEFIDQEPNRYEKETEDDHVKDRGREDQP